jgi:hypothetical protein
MPFRTRFLQPSRVTPSDYAHIWGDVPSIPADFEPPTMNHPSRSRNSPSRAPTGAEVRAARLAANLRPDQAGELVHEREARWMAFERDEARMHPATWELFKLKTGNV